MTGDTEDRKFERGYRAKGKYLRGLRNRAKLSSKDLQAKSGVHFTTINRIENGHNLSPQWNTLEQLAEALGIDALDLVTFLDEEETEAVSKDLQTDENREQIVETEADWDKLDEEESNRGE